MNILASSTSFNQQIVLQLVGPVTATIIGTAIIGGAAHYITSRAQARRADALFRTDLLTRISEAAYAIHYHLEHYSRWLKHANPLPEERASALSKVEDAFIHNRTSLGAIHNEVDAYFGASQPAAGQTLHRLIDLAMVKYMQLTGAPPSQIEELCRFVAGPAHTGLTEEELTDEHLVRTGFATALGDTLNAILNSPIDHSRRFKSTKLLTGPDGATSLPALGADQVVELEPTQ